MQYQFTRHLASAKGLLIIGMLVAVAMVACSSDDQTPQQPATARPAATAQPAAQAEKAATARPSDPAEKAAPAVKGEAPVAGATASPGEAPAPAATARPAARGQAAQAGPLSGEIVIDGSSTVYPVTVAAAEDFRKEHPQVQIPVGISGTGGGFKKFAAGETVISDASRPIKDSERELAAQHGITFIELTVAYDGLSVLVNPDNDWASCLTTDQLHEIWKPDSEISNWNQVDPSYPDLDIVLYGPDADSGTFDYFTEEINGDTGVIRDDFFPAVDDNVLVQGIAGDRGALGYFGYAYYVANTDKLKLVGVDPGDGCVEPSEETINNGTYTPLSRPLYIYVNIPSLNRPEVKAFVDYYLANAADLAASVGYVGLPQPLYDQMEAKVANPVPDVKLVVPEAPTTSITLEGEIVIDGSSTVYPVTVAAAEDFRKDHPAVQIPVGISGTGGGFKKFAAGETVISDASRPIKDSERELAAANGIEFVELTVAYDGLSVLVNPDNDWATCLTTDELHEIWKPDSTISNWNQVRPEFPNQDIVLYGPDADSGTFDYFTEEINGDTGIIRDDFFPAVDDNVLVQGIAGDRGALGYFGYAYYIANADKLKLVGVDSGEGCIEPSEETINNGDYSPLSRPLFIYVNIASLQREEVKSFVDFYLRNAADLAASVGYVGLPQPLYDAGLVLLNNPVPDIKAMVEETAMMAPEPFVPSGPLSGEIVIDGSSTVYPVSVAAAEDFRIEHPNVQIPVGISGTGGGFKKFAAGETVISDASRPIKDSERELAAENGIDFIELTVAFDGLSVLVNPDNDWATCLTVDQLNAIWEPDSEISNWNQVDPSYPNLDIVLYGPDADSGTFDYFTEEINGDTGVIRDDFFPAVDDNVLVQGIAGDRGALGYFGYAYYVANTDKLKLVGVDGGAGCIEPNETTINDGSYSPLSRPLNIYVSVDALAREEVRAFVDFYLRNAADLAASVGYVGLPQQMYDEGLTLVENAATNGTVQR